MLNMKKLFTKIIRGLPQIGRSYTSYTTWANLLAALPNNTIVATNPANINATMRPDTNTWGVFFLIKNSGNQYGAILILLVSSKVKLYIGAPNGNQGMIWRQVAGNEPQLYTNRKEKINLTANIDAPVGGASVTVPAGTYVINGRWQFPSTSATACKIAVGIRAGGSGSGYNEAYTRIQSGDAWWSSLATSICVTVTEQTTFQVVGACGIARSGCNSDIKATRILSGG